MKAFLNMVLLLTLVTATARAQINAGEQAPEPSVPFTMTRVATGQQSAKSILNVSTQ